MIFSFVPWIMIPTLPLWPMSTKARVAAVPILFIAAEVLFWGGAAIGGAELVKHRRQVRTVFRRWVGLRTRCWLRLKHKPCKQR